MSKRGFLALTVLLRFMRVVATSAMCWSALVLATALIAWPEGVGAQGVAEMAAMAKATGEIANALPTDLTRLALQVAIVSMLVNAGLIFAFYRAMSKFGEKPCIMGGETGQAVLGNFCYRAFKQGVEQAEKERDERRK
jgi:ABC-type molybdate transport system permease subunit